VTQVAGFRQHVREQMARVIVGQQEPLDQLTLVLLSGGHALLEGVPGLAKTLTVKALARVCGLRFQRVQCTPDLLPADVLGTHVFDPASARFSLRRGPVFTDALLVDEINRTPSRTQSALLECMEERQVTLDGDRHPLGPHFTVFATQNPVEFEGTYPLPEAQLDRFLLKVRFDYPGADTEAEILRQSTHGAGTRDLDALGLVALPEGALDAARAAVAAVRVEDSLYPYVAAIARRTRDWAAVLLGASPRAALHLLAVAKAAAAAEGRDFLIPDDVKQVAPPVLRHRLTLKPEAELEGVTPDQVVADVLDAVEVPRA
jgi:MoxR-like ATPase